MTYEEKLDLIINEIVESRKRARVGQPAKIFVDKKSILLKAIVLPEIYEILLKLQDDEKIIKVKDYPYELKPSFEVDLDPNKDHFLIEILDNFDLWYEKHLLSQKSKLDNIDFINLLKIYDIVLDIEQQLQIDSSSLIHIPALPQLVRFQMLFPMDSIGSRQIYQGYRWEGINYLFQRDIVCEQKYIEDYMGYGSIKIKVNISNFNPFLKEITEEYKKRNKSAKKPTKTTQTKLAIDSAEQKVSYNSKNGELTIEDKKVKFKKDSFRAKLLELLLNDTKTRKKEWSWDEVIESIEDTKDADLTKEKKKKFYPACDGLSKHIASKINVNDLLIFNKSTVQLNPKYL